MAAGINGFTLKDDGVTDEKCYYEGFYSKFLSDGRDDSGAKVIEVTGPWGSPAHLVRKKPSRAHTVYFENSENYPGEYLEMYLKDYN